MSYSQLVVVLSQLEQLKYSTTNLMYNYFSCKYSLHMETLKRPTF